MVDMPQDGVGDACMNDIEVRMPRRLKRTRRQVPNTMILN